MQAAKNKSTPQIISFDLRRPTDVRSEKNLPPAKKTPPSLVARAEIAAAMTTRIGGNLPTSDIVDLLTKSGAPDRPGLVDLCSVLQRSGYLASRKLDPGLDELPAIAEMSTGQIVLILSRQSDMLTIYESSGTDCTAEVAVKDFAPHHTGWVLRVRLPFTDVEARHTEPGKAPHWFWSEFQHHHRSMAEVALASLVANILATGVSLYAMQIYDRVIPNKSEATLWVLTIGAILAIGFDAALRIARGALMDNTGRKIELAVQERLMQRLLGMKAVPHERRPSQIFAAMRDFSSVREFFTASTIGTLADLPFLIIFLSLVTMIAGNLVWVLVIGGLLMLAPSLVMQSRMIALTQATQGANTRAAKLLYEAVFEHETLTTQRGQDRVKRLWAELTTLSSLRASDQRHLTSALTAWALGIQQATVIVATLIGTYFVFAGSFTVGTVIAVTMLASRTLGPLSQLSAMLARWSNVKAALTGLDAVAKAPQAVDPERRYLRREALKGDVEFHEVSFRYSPDVAPSLDISALSVRAGQHAAVLGANGSGKSTLLRLVAGLYEPSAGRIMLDGLDIGQVHPRDIRRHIGYLGQEVRLIEGTLRDNLSMNDLERDDDRLLAALEFSGLGSFIRNHPRGLDLEIREAGEGLSVGQRQCVGWARLWLQDPQIVLLDEPTAALDQTLEATLVSRLSHWLQGRTALIATHRIPILHLTSRAIILQNGRLAVDGPRDAVLAHLANAGR